VAFTLVSNAPVVVEDLRVEKRFEGSDLLLEHGEVSAMSVIIPARCQPYGVLSAHTSKRRAFTEVDVHFLQTVANVLAAAIERRQLEDELLCSIGREQHRIGQDLHDGLCHQLAGIGFSTELILRDLPDSADVKRDLTVVVQHVGAAIREARMLARGLSPVKLEANGLMSALHELTSITEQLFKISCRFECQQPVLIENNGLATHLYRIVQEAIHNAIKHGQARHVSVRLDSSDGQTTLTITDDGSGLPSEFRSSHGMGLRIMNYRAGMIRGRLSIEPVPGKGTKVICSWKV
jgi:signal transduction histidine kinase